MESRPAYLRIAQRVKQEYLTGPDAVPGTRLPTERMFQARFGVSRSTVARALSTLAGEGWIETRQGSGAYISAGRAVSGRLRLLGFVAPVVADPAGATNPILPALHEGLAAEARARGYQLFSACSNHSRNREEEILRHFAGLGVEGAVVYPAYLPEPDGVLPAPPRWPDLPIVVTDIGHESWGRSMVLFDNRRLAADLVRALLARGHRRILFLHRLGFDDHTSVRERAKGWRDAMGEAGLAIPLAWDGWPAESGVDPAASVDEVADRLLALQPFPDAVVAYDDAYAMGLSRALALRGVDVPGAVRVAGFDHHAEGKWFEPAFPTTDPDFARMGRVAIDLVDAAIRTKGGAARTVVLPAPVLWREPSHRGKATRRKGGSVPAFV
ncbi:MAG: GntR family transcriptional regulator [Armatimonadota bacterium]